MALRPLGEKQKQILHILNHQSGWYPGCRWIWGNRSETIRILDSLVKRGLAQNIENENHPRYSITDYGRFVLSNIFPHMYGHMRDQWREEWHQHCAKSKTE